MQSTPFHRLRRIVVPLVVQALLWTALTVAFAALLRVAAPQSWETALRFAAINWMPWVVLAPAVFWLSGRLPFERGRLWRNIPVHVLACLICVAATLWIATYFTFPSRPPMRPEDRTAALDRGDRTIPERDEPRRGMAFERSDPQHPGQNLSRGQRVERFIRGDGHEPFAHRGPFWWMFVGTTLLRANFDAAVYLIIALAAHAVAFYRRAQDRERHAIALTAGLNRAKLDALRLQLQPHFLFNTLNAISTLVHRDPAAADELIGDLSELLRLSLQTAEHEVPLARELDLLDCYLAIEQARLGDRLRIVRDVEQSTLPAVVPTFLLQPVVENAIRHGIEPRLAPGTVTIRARRIGPSLELCVTDDGVGLAATPAGPSRRGIGIANTEARLQALHGDAAQLSLKPLDRGGVEVRIVLPFTTTARTEAPASGRNPASASQPGGQANAGGTESAKENA